MDLDIYPLQYKKTNKYKAKFVVFLQVIQTISIVLMTIMFYYLLQDVNTAIEEFKDVKTFIIKDVNNITSMFSQYATQLLSLINGTSVKILEDTNVISSDLNDITVIVNSVFNNSV